MLPIINPINIAEIQINGQRSNDIIRKLVYNGYLSVTGAAHEAVNGRFIQDGTLVEGGSMSDGIERAHYKNLTREKYLSTRSTPLTNDSYLAAGRTDSVWGWTINGGDTNTLNGKNILMVSSDYFYYNPATVTGSGYDNREACSNLIEDNAMRIR